MLATVRPFRPHPRPVSDQAFLPFTLSTGVYLWLRVTQSRLGLRSPLAGSPSTGRRIGFVILRTGRSPSVAPHAGIAPAQSLRLPGVNSSRKRTSTALIAPLAGARAPVSDPARWRLSQAAPGRRPALRHPITDRRAPTLIFGLTCHGCLVYTKTMRGMKNGAALVL